MTTDKYQVRFLGLADEDLLEIISYIAADNPSAAEALADKIEKNLELLANNPSLGKLPRDKEIKILGYRYLVVQNYLIFYKIEEKTIFVHRIIHGARNYKSLL